MSIPSYILKSNLDDQSFEVSQKVIDSSCLLKNICALTSVKSEIGIDLPSNAIKTFIEFIGNYEIQKVEGIDRIESETFKNFSTDELVKFVNEISILDCDLLIDCVADYILYDLRKLKWSELQALLEIPDDFNQSERAWMNDNQMEYIISINLEASPLQFPLSCEQNFYTLKSRLYTPMNVLLARMCQRAKENMAVKLSWLCKALKNECDRYPIKVSRLGFNTKYGYYLWIYDYEDHEFLGKTLQLTTSDEEYLKVLTRRKVAVTDDDVSLSFYDPPSAELMKYMPGEWIIPYSKDKTIKILLNKFESHFHLLDLRNFPYSSLSIKLQEGSDIKLDFGIIYNGIFTKHLSKKIMLETYNSNFYEHGFVKLFKKPNSVKFHKCHIDRQRDPLPTFKAFALDYMELDGRIVFRRTSPSIFPLSVVYNCNKYRGMQYCTVSDIIEYLQLS